MAKARETDGRAISDIGREMERTIQQRTKLERCREKVSNPEDQAYSIEEKYIERHFDSLTNLKISAKPPVSFKRKLPYGFKHTEETKRKISQKLQGRIGKPHTLESRKKLSALMSGKNHPMWGKPNHRRTPIIETTTGRHFACQTDAAGILKIKQGDIANCLAGRQKSTKGYQFSYNK